MISKGGIQANLINFFVLIIYGNNPQFIFNLRFIFSFTFITDK